MAKGIQRTTNQLKKNKKRSEWYWQNTIKKGGVNILVAEQSRGKSMLAMQFVKNLVKANRHGETLLDRPVIKRRVKVLYFSTEMNEELIVERFNNLGVNGRIKNIDQFLFIQYQQIISINDIKQQLDETNAEFVVIDVISGLIQGMNLDLNSYQDMNNLAGALRIHFPGITFLLIHHMNKNKSVMGSIATLSSMDTRMEMLETYREIDNEGNTIINQTIHCYGKSVTDTYIDVAFKYPYFNIVYSDTEDEELDKPLSRLIEVVICTADKSKEQSPIKGTYQQVAAQCKMIEKYSWSPKRFGTLLKMNRSVLENNYIYYNIERKAKGYELEIWYDPNDIDEDD